MDVVVLGGGPAGGAAARLLALRGRRVSLLPGSRPERNRHAESLPPSCRKPLGLLGLLGAVEEEGFLATRGNSAAWAGAELKPTDFPSGSGFQVERGRFDRLIVGAAAAAGAEVRDGAVATEVSEREDGISTVRWRSREGSGAVRARWVLDCTGRAGVLAARYRMPSAGPATVALTGVWRPPVEPPGVDPTHTLVESYPDGWAWSVPVAAARRYVAVMIDPAVTRLRGRRLTESYRSEIGRTLHTARSLEGAELVGAPHACSATPFAARRYGGEGFLLVGDAGSFIDPLSSFGVKKALASGWLAAVVANTSLGTPGMGEPALRLFEERERLAQRRYSAFAADYYARAAAYHGTSFWRRRTAAPAETEEPDTDAPGIDPGDPRIAAAFEVIRTAPRLVLRPGGALRRVAVPTVWGCEVVLEEHLHTPELPGPVRYLGAVELPRLLDLACRHEQVPEIFDAYARGGEPADLPGFLRALSALVAFGMLEAGPPA